MLPLLIDENLNHRILRGLLRVVPHIDYVLLSNSELKGAPDPRVLATAAEQNRVLVTHDLRTIPKYAHERTKAGLPMSGVVAIPADLPIGKAIEDLAILVECAAPAELQNVVFFLPL